MAKQTLETVIAINARAGKGFSQVGSTLTELGSIVNGVSQELITFGKDSTKVYRDYEKSMADAEVALSTHYGRNTRELKKVMSDLNVSATEWAATTIFHTNDVANALSEAAHAGWDYDKIMSGLPAAMQLAQAGGLDLSEAVDYIVKSTNAAGIEFKDLGTFIDLWTFGANSSASTIGEFGDAMLRMGSTMRWAADPEELMTLIAVTANAGSVGSEAGTMIRNSIMRLVAPTDKAKKALAAMGATALETSEVMNDEDLFAAYEELVAHGFKGVFNEDGTMRNVLDVYTDMALILGDMAGGMENIGKNEKTMGILSSIFPVRMMTEALNLINAASNNYDGLYDKMKNGEATGYGAYAAETEMDTLYGKMETFESKWERLKQVVGEHLAGQIETATGPLGEVIDRVASMDPDQLDAIIRGAEVIAAAGPGLLLAGGAFRLIGLALTPAGGITAGVIALTAFASIMKQLEESNFADNFGNMEIDTEGIKGYIGDIGQAFRDAYKDVEDFKGAVERAVESYTQSSGTLSSKLYKSMLTGVTLTTEDKVELEGLVNDMFYAVDSALTNRAAATMSYWEIFFGGEGVAENDPRYQELLKLTDGAFSGAREQAKNISKSIRDALYEAWDNDGKIDEEEYQKILSYMEAYNAAIARAEAEAKNKEAAKKRAKLLKRAQTASLDDIMGISKEAEKERDEQIAYNQNLFADYYADAQLDGADAELLASIEAEEKRIEDEINADFDSIINTVWRTQIPQIGQEGYDFLSGIADKYMAGELTGEEAVSQIVETLGKSAYAGDTGLPWEDLTGTDRAQLGRFLGTWIHALGGEDAVLEKIATFEKSGNQERADKLRQLYAMEQLVNGFGKIMRVADSSDPWNWLLGGFSTSTQNDEHGYVFTDKNKGIMESDFWASDMSTVNAKNGLKKVGSVAVDYLEAIGKAAKEEADNPTFRASMTKKQRAAYENILEGLMKNYDLDRLLADSDTPYASEDGKYRYDYAAWKLLYGMTPREAEQYRIQVPVDPVFSEDVVVPIRAKAEGEDSMIALQEQGVSVDVDADGTKLEAVIDGADGQTLMEYLNGDAENLHMTIWDENGQVLEQIVTGNTADLDAALNKYDDRVIRIRITGTKLFAEGGRATSASIFGEAGPEWAIPEEHSERTANLLNAARAASGFTWPDILGRFGGLNADANHTPATIIYSPTINAADASGVEQVLREDKKRWEKWFEEKKIRDDLEVYA